MPEGFWTPSGVRLRTRARRSGDLNWLFLPGGPGIGSDSLYELVDAVEVPGTSWMVDLPGDGSNVSPPGAFADPYDNWPLVVLEAALSVKRPVFVGHSTGGEYLLSVPELERHLVGIALVSTAPHAGWFREYQAMTERDPLPRVTAATERFNAEPTNANLRDIAVESAPWNFTAQALGEGAALLGRMPYNLDAVAWSAENFDTTYELKWWPTELPTLIVSGASDRIVSQGLWDDVRYQGGNVIRAVIDGGAHFPWIERPRAVRAAFAELASAIYQSR